MPASISDEWAVQDFLSRGVSLLIADQLWTRSLGRSELTSAAIGELATLGSTYVLSPWLHITDSETAKPVRDWITDRVEAAYEEIRGRVTMEPDQTPIWLANSSVFAAAGIEGFSRLIDMHHEEAERIRAKIRALEKGDWTPGDLSPEALCTLLLTLSMAAACTGAVEMANYLLALYVTSGCGQGIS